MIRDRIAAVLAGEEGALKPCPFCQGAAGLCKLTTGHTTVLCTDCRAEGPRRLAGAPADAIAAWNRRAPSPATLDALVALVEEETEQCAKIADNVAQNAYALWEACPPGVPGKDSYAVHYGAAQMIATAIRKGPHDE